MAKRMTVQLILTGMIFIFSHSLGGAQEGKIFSMPFNMPFYGSPPLQYTDSKFVSVAFKTSPDVLRKLVPQPLIPNPDNVMYVYTSSLNILGYKSGNFSFQGGNYYEVVMGIPAKFREASGNYCAVMYLDYPNDTGGRPGVAIGREIWGYPKKEAIITFEEKDGKVHSTVSRARTPLIKLSFERTLKVEPPPPRPRIPTFNLKYIPSVKKDAPPEVMQLTSNVSELNRKELWKGKGSLEFGSLSADPLGDIPVLEIIAAQYEVAEGSLLHGEIVYDYLAKGPK
jgi:acetoacetate decarboxylase